MICIKEEQDNLCMEEEEKKRNEALWSHYNWDEYGGRFAGFTFNLQRIASLSIRPAIHVQVGLPYHYKGCIELLPDGDLIATPMNPDRSSGFLSLVYRSSDYGSTWGEIARPIDLPGKEHCLKALSDGTLLHISLVARYPVQKMVERLGVQSIQHYLSTLSHAILKNEKMEHCF